MRISPDTHKTYRYFLRLIEACLKNSFHYRFQQVKIKLSLLIGVYYLSYQVVFILNFLCIFWLMKFASWFSLEKSKRKSLVKSLFGTPALSASERIHPLKTSIPLIGLKLLLSTTFLGLIILFSKNFLNLHEWFQVILISPVIYLLTETLGCLGQLSGMLAGLNLPAIHDHPLKSRSLSDFWGRKWNRWVQDWLRDVTRKYHRHPNKKLILTFLISGLFHELMVNLPYYFKYGEIFFGNMLLYFSFQATGLFLEKKIGHSLNPVLRRFYLWLFILLPSPLFLNYPLKLFIGLTHG